MKDYEICGYLADLETYLSGCEGNAAPGSKAEKQFESWRQAVNCARAYIISHMAQEDDGDG